MVAHAAAQITVRMTAGNFIISNPTTSQILYMVLTLAMSNEDEVSDIVAHSVIGCLTVSRWKYYIYFPKLRNLATYFVVFRMSGPGT